MLDLYSVEKCYKNFVDAENFPKHQTITTAVSSDSGCSSANHTNFSLSQSGSSNSREAIPTRILSEILTVNASAPLNEQQNTSNVAVDSNVGGLIDSTLEVTDESLISFLGLICSNMERNDALRNIEPNKSSTREGTEPSEKQTNKRRMDGDAENHNKKPKLDKPMKCEKCNDVYKTEESLTTHMEEKHPPCDNYN